MSAAEVFELPIAVAPEDIDQLGHVNNVVYVRWVQDVAVAHWRARAPQELQDALLWVVLRHEIDYKQSAELGDEILARTWVGEATRAKFERLTELRRAGDGALLAQAKTVWCPLNAQTRRPAGVRAGVIAMFGGGGAAGG